MRCLAKIFFPVLILPFSLLLSQEQSSQTNFPGEYLSSDKKPENIKPREFVIVNDIQIIGNKVTRRHIILRELPFSVNDTIGKSEVPEKLKSSKENLLNTSLFNFVTVDTLSAGNNRINIFITVAERWYTWPIPIFEVQERNFNEWWKTKNFNRANYGFYLNRENFRGRKEELSFYAQFGYTVKYGVSYKIPYLTRKQISGAGFSFSYARNREVAYRTYNNFLVYFKNPDDYVRAELTGKLNFTYRGGIYNKHYIEGKFVQAIISDTLKNYTIDYFVNNETEMKYFALDYSYTSDHRNSKVYPLNGYYFEIEVARFGFGILKNEKLNLTNLYLSLRGYEKLSNRFYGAGNLKIKFSPDKNQPYYLQRGLGWSDYVRGYEYYVIDGQSYGLAKLGLKYEIIKPKIKSVPALPWSKFNTFHYALYAGIFGDAGYVDDHQYSLVNPLSNSLLYGYGIGIDYVTYYDIVFRLEYSFNKMFEHGLFVHFEAGI
jgi:outer membrane protein assembly factor BamA